ncbi:MAG: amidohydrolase family protein [Acidimicrobiales bacterium]
MSVAVDAADGGAVASRGAGHIDVHAHFLPASYVAAAERAGVDHPDGIHRWPSWDVDGALTLMDDLGIASAVLSVSTPGLLLGGPTDVVGLARRVNEEGAEIARHRPDRFGFFASLPLPDVEAATEEAAFALDHLGADGVVFMSSYDGLYFGDRRLDPLFDELDARRAVAFVHPTSPMCWEHTALDRPRPLLEFFFDSTRAISNYLLMGGPQRFPAVEVIAPHGGAALPALFDRVVGFVERGATSADVTADEVAEGLRRLWFDLAGFAAAQQSFAIRRLAGADRLLYGSDYPYTAGERVAQALDELRTVSALSVEEVGEELRRNALRLFPRFGGRA